MKRYGDELNTIRSTKTTLWIVLAISLIVLQLLVHGVFNSQTVSILPSDGCGQVLDNALKEQLELLLRVAELSSLLFSILFAFTVKSTFWNGVLLLLAAAAVTGLLRFGWMSWHYKAFLTSCDILFMGSKAAN